MPLEFISERTFSVNGLTLAAKEWGDPSAPPVFAVHGWLDNCASFEPMIEHLNNIHLLAIDCAGHGKSDFRSQDSDYNIWKDAFDIIGIADHMEWQQFSLLAHSRGAIISNIVAGAFSDRVSRVVLLDGHMPIPVDPEHAARQLAMAHRDNKRFSKSSPTYFDTFDEAVKGRANGFIPIDESAALVLAARGVVEGDRGFFWHNDQRLKSASEFKLTKKHIRSFFKSITAEVLFIEAEKNNLNQRHDYSLLFEHINCIEHVCLPGSHFMHMENQSKSIAERVNKFFSRGSVR